MSVSVSECVCVCVCVCVCLCVYRFTVKPLNQLVKRETFNAKTEALVDLCLTAFNMSQGKEDLLQSLLRADWCRLFSSIVMKFNGKRRDQAIEGSGWIFQRLNQFSDVELPPVSLFASLQSEFLKEIKKNMNCGITTARIGNLTTAAYATFFMMWQNRKTGIIKRKCIAKVGADWRTGGQNIKLLSDTVWRIHVGPGPDRFVGFDSLVSKIYISKPNQPIFFSGCVFGAKSKPNVSGKHRASKLRPCKFDRNNLLQPHVLIKSNFHQLSVI